MPSKKRYSEKIIGAEPHFHGHRRLYLKFAENITHLFLFDYCALYYFTLLQHQQFGREFLASTHFDCSFQLAQTFQLTGPSSFLSSANLYFEASKCQIKSWKLSVWASSIWPFDQVNLLIQEIFLTNLAQYHKLIDCYEFDANQIYFYGSPEFERD